MPYGWEEDDTAVRTAILLEQTLKELDDRYKKATELSEELLKELDERYKTATAISAELQKTLDQRYETAKKLSKDLYEELDKRYGTLTEAVRQAATTESVRMGGYRSVSRKRTAAGVRPAMPMTRGLSPSNAPAT